MADTICVTSKIVSLLFVWAPELWIHWSLSPSFSKDVQLFIHCVNHVQFEYAVWHYMCEIRSIQSILTRHDHNFVQNTEDQVGSFVLFDRVEFEPPVEYQEEMRYNAQLGYLLDEIG